MNKPKADYLLNMETAKIIVFLWKLNENLYCYLAVLYFIKAIFIRDTIRTAIKSYLLCMFNSILIATTFMTEIMT